MPKLYSHHFLLLKAMSCRLRIYLAEDTHS